MCAILFGVFVGMYSCSISKLGTGVVEVRTDELGTVVGTHDHRRLARSELALRQRSLVPERPQRRCGQPDVVIHDHAIVHVKIACTKKNRFSATYPYLMSVSHSWFTPVTTRLAAARRGIAGRCAFVVGAKSPSPGTADTASSR